MRYRRFLQELFDARVGCGRLEADRQWPSEVGDDDEGAVLVLLG